MAEFIKLLIVVSEALLAEDFDANVVFLSASFTGISVISSAISSSALVSFLLPESSANKNGSPASNLE